MTIIIFISICFLILIIRYAWLYKHHKWFSTLKPGDRIKVKIFANYCECYKEAEVIDLPFDIRKEFIHAKVIESDVEACKKCSHYNNEVDTCWYHIDVFRYTEVKKL